MVTLPLSLVHVCSMFGTAICFRPLGILLDVFVLKSCRKPWMLCRAVELVAVVCVRLANLVMAQTVR